MKTIRQVSAGGIVFKLITNHQSLITNRLWLVGQHSQHKGWVFLKGLVGDKDTDESKEAAALREVEEEGGIKARIVINEPIVVSYEYVWKNELIKKTVYYYLMEYISGNTKNHDWEMSDVKFLPEDEIKKTLTYPSDKLAFEKALKLI